ncbi:hypothetical protein N7489_008838 [Penicillium chrysogenum]|uniref:2-iminobutanoate/2-iminopropanoate deaminase n=1 Tax=Penicillium chrysogenum TaxID=5076 RepID=A0ABQ8WYV0_PENCH|nr:uncharacterized protein N7489_008838 [Penicillium chrysogenum]KAJ5228130.1 hypothetical protein N7489_008838 [Penicillium chrysogenum]KAJ5257526.1 hypothetical protein N7524_009082 [Penicillium chrysogenum]KAJ5284233.1 hypothetical protein N7505_002213 [Penicillium chrysogenum]
MSHLTYYNYDGVGTRNREHYSYSQAVRIGDRIECSGQGGWDPSTGELAMDAIAQIDQAFKNVELNLRNAGGTGWEQVFRVNSYLVPMDDEAMEAMVQNLRKYMPNHQPVWTCVGVTALAEDAMKVEIEVVAHDPK